MSYEPLPAVSAETAAFVAHFTHEWPAFDVVPADCGRLRRLAVSFSGRPVSLTEAHRVAAWCYAHDGYHVVRVLWGWRDGVVVRGLELVREV